MGIVPHLLASVLGLSAVLHVSALAFQTLKYAGSVYLLYLAWSMWRETGALKLNQPDKNNAFQTAVRGFLINILNPKLSLFFLAFLPLFVSPKAVSPIPQMLMLSAVFMAMTLVIFIFYGILADNVRGYFANSPRVITRLQRSFAAVFAALAIKLALSER
jgi:threonine/homoserine/homoserine lactone efflux protein